MINKPVLSIVVPVYNMEKRIVNNLLEIKRTVAELYPGFEIIVVDDGSLDKTSKQLSSIKDEKIVATGYKLNKGKGYAIRYGCMRAKGELIAFLDADLGIHPIELRKLLNAYEKKKVEGVIGSKHMAETRSNYPVHRSVLSQLYTYFEKFLFRLPYSDTQAGIKLFNKNVIACFLKHSRIDRFAFDLELLLIAKKRNFKIIEVPIKVNHDQSTSTIHFKDICKMIFDTLAIANNYYTRKIYDPND